MKLVVLLCAFTLVASFIPSTSDAQQRRGYYLRDTTSLPPPAEGMARLVVARDMTNISEQLKPEFVYLDRTAIGILPQRTAVTAEVPPGWHRVWLGRGGSDGVWMEFVAGGRYLFRLRETIANGSWRGDLIRENPDGYIGFALGREMKLAVMDARGKGSLERELGPPPSAKEATKVAAKDSAARARALANATLPIVIKEAWYLPIPSGAASNMWESHPGTLTIDETTVRYVRADTLVVEIPRDRVTDVYFGSQKGDSENPWIKLGYTGNLLLEGATFADSSPSTATETYNRLFAELAKKPAPR